MIIGIGHVKQVGKDTAATALVRDLGFRRDSFAGDMKKLALAIDPLIVAEPELVNVRAGQSHLNWLVRAHGEEFVKSQYPEARRFLQNLGTEMREMFGEDIWVNRVESRLHDDAGRFLENVVIPDVRFLNEAAWVKRMGGKLIKIERPGFQASGHISELELVGYDGWDYVVRNDGDVGQLQLDVVEWVQAQMNKQRLAA